MPGASRHSRSYSLWSSPSLLLVHGVAYDGGLLHPPLPRGLGRCHGGVALLLFPTAQFSAGFCVGAYALYAAVIAMMVFFSGGVSSELYVLFFPLLLASALHGSWRITLAALFAVLFCYALAVMPGLLDDLTGNESAAVVFYRLCSLGLTGVFLVW